MKVVLLLGVLIVVIVGVIGMINESPQQKCEEGLWKSSKDASAQVGEWNWSSPEDYADVCAGH